MLEPIRLHAPPKKVALAGARSSAAFTEEDVEASRRDGYRRGTEEATKLLERQMIEQRSEIVALQSGTFAAIAQQQEELTRQMQEVVPALALEAVARLLADATFDRDTIIRIANDLLTEVATGREEVELQLSPHDLDLIAGYEETFREKHPAIVFRANPDLRSGDCKILSRFGFIDGRLCTKLRALEGFLK